VRRQASELADTSKTEFLSRVSHEMRTPLNAVIGFAQLLQMQQISDTSAPTRNRTHEYAEHIRVAGEHLLSLVTDLLDLNRVAQGELKLQTRALPLADAVQEVVQLLRLQAQHHGLQLDHHVDSSLQVLADPTRLRQVLLNLTSNALKYNHQGGTVRISATLAAQGAVMLQVQDSGIGMTAEQLDNLFQPFERLGAERTTVQGTGLGLVIARSLVRAMGGELSVASTPAVGTLVSVVLMLAP
jgi:signal transduction histidine kinase